MKRKDLIKRLKANGWWLKRQGKHEIWTNGDMTEPVPRHKEIDEYTARSILKRITNNPGKGKEF